MAEQKSSSALTAPLRDAASALRKVPGAEMVRRAAEETLDKVGAVSPRGRRMAVYAGAGLLGAAGVVEWPVALTGAAVAWITQPRPAPPPPAPADADSGEAPHDIGTAALRSGTGAHAHARAGDRKQPSAAESSTPKTAAGPLGPTARPDRTTL